jgi:hypothetical protein
VHQSIPLLSIVTIVYVRAPVLLLVIHPLPPHLNHLYSSMSLLLAMAAVPGMLGTQEAIRQGQQKERREEHRARRCNLVASCIKSSPRALEINGRPIVLRDGAVRSQKPRITTATFLTSVSFMLTHVALKMNQRITDTPVIFYHILTANTRAL